MKVKIIRLAGALCGGALAASVVVISAVGSAETATGDSCTAAGSGTAYTLNIAIPSGAPEQFGFAFGVLGATVTNVNVAGVDGSFSTQALPPAASGAWVTLSPIEPGSAVASLVTSAPVKGSFSVVPVSTSQAQPGYFQPITCSLASAPVVSSTFTVDRHATYDQALEGMAPAGSDPRPRHSERDRAGADNRDRGLSRGSDRSNARPGEKSRPDEQRDGHVDPPAYLPRPAGPRGEKVAPHEARGLVRSRGGQALEPADHGDAAEVSNGDVLESPGIPATRAEGISFSLCVTWRETRRMRQTAGDFAQITSRRPSPHRPPPAVPPRPPGAPSSIAPRRAD